MVQTWKKRVNINHVLRDTEEHDIRDIISTLATAITAHIVPRDWETNQNYTYKEYLEYERFMVIHDDLIETKELINKLYGDTPITGSDDHPACYMTNNVISNFYDAADKYRIWIEP